MLVLHCLLTVHSSPRTVHAVPKACMMVKPALIQYNGRVGSIILFIIPGQVVGHPQKSPLFLSVGQSCFLPT